MSQPSTLSFSDTDFAWLVGRLITEIRLLEHGFWVFDLDEKAHINVECPWRLLTDWTVAVSSIDHGQQYGLPAPVDARAVAQELVSGAPITAVAVREGTSDLLIESFGRWRLEIITFSSGYESWQVCDPYGRHFIALGGGEISMYLAPDANEGK